MNFFKRLKNLWKLSNYEIEANITIKNPTVGTSNTGTKTNQALIIKRNRDEVGNFIKNENS